MSLTRRLIFGSNPRRTVVRVLVLAAVSFITFRWVLIPIRAEGISMLPGSLSEAVDVMERSELVAEALGEHVFEWFLRNKRAEWRDYKTQITQFELDRYYRNV